MAKIFGEMERASIEQLGALPSVGTKGRVVYLTSDNSVYYDDGSNYRKLLISSSAILAVTTKTTTYTALTTDDLILCDTSGGAFTITLPTAAGNTGKTLVFKKTTSDTSILTIDGNGAETIDGLANIKMGAQNDFVKIVSDGTNWRIIEDGILVSTILRLSADQTISNVTDTRVNPDVATLDTLGAFNTSTYVYTAQRPGTYTFSGYYGYPNDTDGTRWVSYKKNGGSVVYVAATNAGTATNASRVAFTFDLVMAATDTFEFWTYHDAGGSLNLLGGSTPTSLSIKRVK